MDTRETVEQLPIRELLEALLDTKAKRRLELHKLTNRTLFDRYERQQLAIRNQDPKTFRWNRLLLKHFQSFLRGQKPTSDLARDFLASYQGRATPYSLYKYACTLRGFLEWYGEDTDITITTERPLPPYIPHETVMAFRAAMLTKPRQRQTIPRDVMIVDVAYGAGLRRREISNLRVSDLALNEKFLVVRKGKGRKDRVVYLPDWLVDALRAYTAGMAPDARIFGISPARISDLMVTYSNHAGIKLTPHDLRHAYGTRLAERGVPLPVIQSLMGHADISTTRVYTAFTDRHAREAVQALMKPV